MEFIVSMAIAAAIAAVIIHLRPAPHGRGDGVYYYGVPAVVVECKSGLAYFFGSRQVLIADKNGKQEWAIDSESLIRVDDRELNARNFEAVFGRDDD